VKVELDISIEFESPETGSWAASRKSDFRSEVVTAISTMSGMTREILLTPEGKARVRDRIRKRMDDWLPSGARVKRVYFNQFVVR
jgi:flagellar basal body-associated protein FliL